MSAPLYDTIGTAYSTYRRPDPRVAARINAALEGCETVLNVGAGTGSYEPDATGVRVVAVEPSNEMIAQRSPSAAPVVRAVAEHLPAANGSFDGALASLTVHHWPDAIAGLREMTRVARRQVVFGFDPEFHGDFWLVDEYLPSTTELDSNMRPTVAEVIDALGADADVLPVPVPHDCVDGFFWAYWRRPEAYLDPVVRSCISAIALLDPVAVDDAVSRLAADLESGAWHRRHADLLELDELDGGFRIVVAGDR